MSKMSLDESEPVKTSMPAAWKESMQVRHAMSNGAQHEMDSPIASNKIFFTDVNGSNTPVYTGLPPPNIQRLPSPARSESSEEIIIFAGRHASQIKASEGQASKTNREQRFRQASTELSPSAKKTGRVVIDDPIDRGLQYFAPTQNARTSQTPPLTKETDTGPLLVIPSGKENPITKKRRRGKRGKASARAVEEAEIVADYIANTYDSDDLNALAKVSGLKHRDLGGSDTIEWQDKEEQVDVAMNRAEDWDSADLQDFDGLSTSSEAPDAIAEILFKRERPSGKQYLVIGQGLTTDDACWLPVNALDAPDASEMIREFEEEHAEFERLLGDSDNSDEDLTKDEQLAHDLQEKIDDIEDERDLEERRLAKMTDEQIARLLSKQEELGLGSDNLMLFNATSFSNEGDEVPQLDGTLTTSRQSVPRARGEMGSRVTQPSFPSAITFAAVLDQDPYNGFDIMDQERPSLRKLPKGRRGKLPIELSDSELEQTLKSAWENDRSKKKVRKQEREELRAQGLLGKKGKLDMKAKYSEGMTVAEAKKEIRNFLSSSLERYRFIASISSVSTKVQSVCLCHQWATQNAK